MLRTKEHQQVMVPMTLMEMTINTMQEELQV